MTNNETRYISLDRMWLIFDTLNTRVVKDLSITIYRDGIEIYSNFIAFNYFAKPNSDSGFAEEVLDLFLDKIKYCIYTSGIKFSEITTCKDFYCTFHNTIR